MAVGVDFGTTDSGLEEGALTAQLAKSTVSGADR
jgi:hypothetical protein